MTAAEILAQSAISQGYDVKKTEVAGMAQRGGVVTSHVRFGKKINSPAIPPGEADLMVAFEPAEASRWMDQLRPNGIILANQNEQVPPIVNAGLFEYPDNPVATIEQQGFEIHAFDATKIAKDLGNLRLVNTVMLGASAAYLPFSADVLKEAILARFRKKKPKLVAINEQAFAAGQDAA